MALPRYLFWLMDLPPRCLECLQLIAHSCLLHWGIALGCRNWFNQGYAPLEGAAQGPILAARGIKANTLAFFMHHFILGAPAAATLQVSFSHCPSSPSFFPYCCSSPWLTFCMQVSISMPVSREHDRRHNVIKCTCLLTWTVDICKWTSSPFLGSQMPMCMCCQLRKEAGLK